MMSDILPAHELYVRLCGVDAMLAHFWLPSCFIYDVGCPIGMLFVPVYKADDGMRRVFPTQTPRNSTHV